MHRTHTTSSSTSPPPPPPLPPLSDCSSAAVPDSIWFAREFQLAASMVIIQPSTAKVVVVHDTQTRRWFLPRGRKDRGESIEQCALREAYEESGYRAEFMPLCTPTRALAAPGQFSAGASRTAAALNTEPIYITTQRFGPYRRRSGALDNGGEYLAFYYVGQIPHDAVREENTGMPDEQAYVGTLLDVHEAVQLLPQDEALITTVAYNLWVETRRRLDREREQHATQLQA